MQKSTVATRARTRTAFALLVAFTGAASIHVIVRAQQGGAGQNISVITGSEDQFTGDRFRQRQNEGMIGISSVNPSHMMVVYNDARTVDYADDLFGITQSPAQSFVAKVLDFFRAPWRRDRERKDGFEADGPAAMPVNQAWIGMSFSDNGGKNFYTGLHPGNYGVQIPSDIDPGLIESGKDVYELSKYAAASDPVIGATHKEFFVGAIAFNMPAPDGDGKGIGFISRFTDYNDTETGQNIRFDGTKILLKSEQFVTSSATNFFVDKPSVAAAPGAPNDKAYVYAAFVVFDTTDPLKLASKVLFYRSTNSGESWAGPVVVSQPLTRNQAPWIVIDPNNPLKVYIGWRVFANPLYPNLTNAIVGRKSVDGGATFNPSVPYPVALLLKAYDVPQGNLSAGTLPSPRSAAYPTATIDSSGAITALMQEYVYPATYPNPLLRGLPLAPNASPTTGVPRITATTSLNEGATWSIRKAIDLGSGAGSQFMPTITAVGEPGLCPGKTTPASRVIAMFYDGRASGIGVNPSLNGGIVAGGDKRFDVRVAQASSCSVNALTGLSFSPSEQVSQYTRSSTKDASGTFPIVTKTSLGVTVPATNNAFSMSCTGNCAFTGDYNHVTSRTGYVKVANGSWKLTTAAMGQSDRNKLPAPVVQAVWADTRDVMLPSSGFRPATAVGESLVDQLNWSAYVAPGSGGVCTNPGSRDQNVYTAEYTPGGLFASAPVTFKSSSTIPRAYPLYVENRTGQSRSYLLTIVDPSTEASFDYVDFDPTVLQVLHTPPVAGDHNGFGRPYAQQQAIAIGPISSVTGTVVVGPGVSTPIAITVEETNVLSPAVPAKTTVMLNPAPVGGTATETYQPVVAPDPIVTKPFGTIPVGGKVFNTSTNVDPTIPTPTPFSPNPFSPDPFSPNPFSPNPFSPNPFSPNPFSPNPFSPNAFPPDTYPSGFPTTVVAYDVTDISYVVTNEGEQTAAFAAFTRIQNAAGLHVVQVLLNRAVPATTLLTNGGTCVPADTFQAVPISTFATPFSPNPFSPNPFSPNPFSPNPFSPNPFSPNAVPSDLSNATFYVKPSEPGSGGLQAASVLSKYVGDPIRDFMVVGYRDYLLTPGGAALSAQNLIFTLKAELPEVAACADCPGGIRYDPAGPPATGTQIPHHLAFSVQPATTTAGASMTPAVAVSIRDAFNNTVTNSALPVTMAIGNNPSGGTLAGTLIRNAVNGIATFSDLSIDKGGTGYTLVASSANLASATSEAFNVIARVLIVGNSAADGNGPIATISFPDGAQLGSFIPSGAAVGTNNGRGLAVLNNEVYYTELSNSYGPTDFIRVAPFNNGAGGADTRTIPNPRQGFGVQDLAFSGGVLYILTGYYPLNSLLQVFQVNPSTGAVLSAPVTISGPLFSADGFAVLPNGQFLINDGDGSCTYNQYNPSTGMVISGTTITVPGGTEGCTGVDTDGMSLYFQRNFNSIVQTDLQGNLIASVPVSVASPGCEGISECFEDIAVVIPAVFGERSVLSSQLTNPANGVIYRTTFGDVLVADYGANRVARVIAGGASAGATTTFAAVTSPDEMAINSAGEVFVKTHPAGPISRFTSGGTLLNTFATPGSGPTGLAFDAAGNLYSADCNGTIYKFAAGTFAEPSLFASGLGCIEGIAFSPSGQLFAALFDSGEIYQITPGGTTASQHVLWLSGLTGPLNLAFDPIRGEMYASNMTAVLRIPSIGTAITIASGFSQTYDLDFDPAGNLYVDDFGASKLWKFTRVQ
jgi:hypothetical protein